MRICSLSRNYASDWQSVSCALALPGLAETLPPQSATEPAAEVKNAPAAYAVRDVKAPPPTEKGDEAKSLPPRLNNGALPTREEWMDIYSVPITQLSLLDYPSLLLSPTYATMRESSHHAWKLYCATLDPIASPIEPKEFGDDNRIRAALNNLKLKRWSFFHKFSPKPGFAPSDAHAAKYCELSKFASFQATEKLFFTLFHFFLTERISAEQYVEMCSKLTDKLYDFSRFAEHCKALKAVTTEGPAKPGVCNYNEHIAAIAYFLKQSADVFLLRDYLSSKIAKFGKDRSAMYGALENSINRLGSTHSLSSPASLHTWRKAYARLYKILTDMSPSKVNYSTQRVADHLLKDRRIRSFLYSHPVFSPFVNVDYDLDEQSAEAEDEVD